MTITSSAQDKLLAALEFESVPTEEREALLLELNELVFKGAMIRLLERMNEPDREELAHLIEHENSEDGLEAFLQDRMPVMDQVVAETLTELTDDILAVTGTNTK